ncbi:Nucleolar protein [Salix suchowensis]|nr:Nucleolar protein [Salix suchowensis]
MRVLIECSYTFWRVESVGGGRRSTRSMSLSSVLIKVPGASKLDSELDALFQSSRKKAKLQHADPAVGTSAPSIGQEKGKGKGKKVKIVLPEEAEEVAEVPVCGEQDLSDASLGEADAPPVHESLRKGKKKIKTARQVNFVLPEETPTKRNMRTIFIGNLPLAVAQKKESFIFSTCLPPCMDPYEAALLAAKEADGTTFMERVLESTSLRRVEFIAGLRVYFEGVVATERGPPPESDKESTWVTRVRIVRDKDTQLGKGFAYVQFIDRECVDELLSMEEGKLRFAKRKLRVQRCKVLPNKSNPSSPSNKKGIKGNRPEPEPVVIPKGDPSLGVRIATLSKDERKKVKASSTYRVARRLAKKKARNALSAEASRSLRRTGLESGSP